MVNMGVKMEIRVQVSHKYAGQLPPSHLFDCDSSDWLGSGENSFEEDSTLVKLLLPSTVPIHKRKMHKRRGCR